MRGYLTDCCIALQAGHARWSHDAVLCKKWLETVLEPVMKALGLDTSAAYTKMLNNKNHRLVSAGKKQLQANTYIRLR